MNALQARDERELSIDRAADRLAYIVTTYGLLLLVIWRSLTRGEAAWDLLGLVIVGGAVSTAYRVINGTLTRSWLVLAGISLVLGAVVAALIVLGTRL
jgi:hypothetical protein